MYKYKPLIKNYFKENSLVSLNIESFNNFIDKELHNIIQENKEIEPTIIPHNIEEFKIRFDSIEVKKPEITEADGSKRPIFPIEARLRKLSYSAPTIIEVSSHINGVQREQFKTQVANLPIMLKSKYCHLYKLSEEELIENGEDPYDPGSYFIINGTERVIIGIEDLASNNFLVEKAHVGPSEYAGKYFSERGSFKIPHTIERMKDGIFYISFTKARRIPIIIIIKALGLIKDEEIMNFVSRDKRYDEVIVNLYEFADMRNEEDALDYIAKRIGITQSKDIRKERMKEILDKYLLPNLGITKDARTIKAYNLCKMIKKYILVSNGEIEEDDKDNYMNKRLKLSGDLLSDLFRVNFKVLIG